jgi:hypothetical protein
VKRLFSRLLKILIGLLFIPFCIGFTWQLGETLATVHYKPEAPYYFVGGAILYLVVHLLLHKPVFAYVMGHELTHALFALLFGGSVKSLHAGDRGGRVVVTKSNVLITLAPYFFPLYTAICLLLYAAARFGNADARLMNILVGAGGATFAFHLVLTGVFLGTDQSDIQEHGAFFSYPLIYLFNVAFAVALVAIYLATDLNYGMYLLNSILKSFHVVLAAAGKIGEFASRF